MIESIKIFCARRSVNKDPKGPCEERVVHSARPFAVRGDEPRCAECGRVLAFTWGVHGNFLVSPEGDEMPDPSDPRNRGIETGDAVRARWNSLGK